MTNAEKFKTAEERQKAFMKFCSNKSCSKCHIWREFKQITNCKFIWLDIEYEETPKPCPFCGHTEVDIVLSGCHGGFDACCKDCGATVTAESKTMVIEKWNRRS